MATEIATGYVSIVPSMRGFSQKLSTDVSKAAGTAGDEGGKRFSSGMMSHIKGLAVALGGAFAVTKGIDFFKQSIREASDLNESINAVNVTFGKSAKGIQKLSADAATNMGLSKTEFNELAVRFSNFATTVAGKGGDVVGTMKDLTGRAADFASVMNLDVNDAAELFQSGLAGETEPLRKYGIDMSAAKVSAYALSHGIADSAQTMTESQKVQARYQLLMRQTSKTQGDFANTSDGLANKQRIMAAEWKNAKASIGDALLPVMEGLVGFIADKVVPAVQSFGDWFKNDGGPAIGRFGATLRDTVLPPLQAIVGWIIQYKDVLMPIAGVILGMVAAYRTWAFVTGVVTVAQTALNFALNANPIGLIVMAIAGLVAGLVLAYKKVGWFRDIVDAAWQWIKSATEAVWPVIQKIIEVVWGAISWWVEHYVKAVWAVISTVWDWIKKGVEVVWPGIQKTIQVVWAAISWYVSHYIGLVKAVVGAAWDVIKGTTQTAWRLIKTFIINPVVTVHQRIVEIVGTVKGWLGDAWTSIKDRASTAWQNIKDAILNPLRNLWASFKTILGIGEGGIQDDGPLGRLIGVFGKVKDAIVSVFSGIKHALATPIVEAFKWINNNVIGPLNEKLLAKIKAPNLPPIPIPPGYAKGGWVDGPGTGTSDSVLIRASKGEYIVNAKAAKANAGTIAAINNGATGQTNVQSSGVSWNPAGWMAGLFTKGAQAVVGVLTSKAADWLGGTFGSSTGGSIAVGAAKWLFDGLGDWAKELMTAPTQLMEALARYFEAMVDRRQFVGYHTCLANVNKAMAVMEARFGFATNSWLDARTAAATTSAVQRAGLMRHGTPPRGAIVLWNSSIGGGAGHIAVADGKGNTMNNWGGSIVESISLASQQAGLVGWTPPESFIVGKYDSGGYLPPGWSMAYNGTGRPEPVLTADQWDRVGSQHTWNVNVTEAPVEQQLVTLWRRQEALMGVV